MTVSNEEELRNSGDFSPENVDTIENAHRSGIIGVEFVSNNSMDGEYLVTCGRYSLKFWKLSLDESCQAECVNEFCKWRCGTQSFAVTSDGSLSLVVCVDSTLHLISTLLDGYKKSIDSPVNIGLMEIWHICILNDGAALFTVSFSGSIRLLGRSGSVIKSATFNGAKHITAVCSSPNGKLVAVANHEGVVVILDASTLETVCLFEAHTLKVRALCFAPNSQEIFSGSEDKIIKNYKIDQKNASFKMSFCGHQGSVICIKFSKNEEEQMFASCCYEGSVIVWSTLSDAPVHIFRHSRGGIMAMSVAFSHDSRFLISVGEDQNICVHRLSTNEDAFYQDDSVTDNDDVCDGMSDQQEETSYFDRKQLQYSSDLMKDDSDDFGDNGDGLTV